MPPFFYNKRVFIPCDWVVKEQNDCVHALRPLAYGSGRALGKKALLHGGQAVLVTNKERAYKIFSLDRSFRGIDQLYKLTDHITIISSLK